jgi:hypothetical protein
MSTFLNSVLLFLVPSVARNSVTSASYMVRYGNNMEITRPLNVTVMCARYG